MCVIGTPQTDIRNSIHACRRVGHDYVYSSPFLVSPEPESSNSLRFQQEISIWGESSSSMMMTIDPEVAIP